ncbi:MAG: grasp-with-spasm system ATP-grasp peptide maturase [Crocinitomicaceae bacterium]
MILIYSNNHDFSTNEVCRILLKNGTPFIRVNDITFFESLKIDSNGNLPPLIQYENLNLIEEIHAIWYRREPENKNLFKNIALGPLERTLLNHKETELKVIRNYLNWRLNDKFWLNHPSFSSLNKIFVLDIAKKVGLKTAEWVILNNTKDIIEHLESGRVITKPLFETIGIENDSDHFNTRTQEVKREDIQNIEIGTSFIQKMIEKESEIRVVFLEGECFSMEIHSQKNEHTKIDFRNYNIETPLRFTAFKLPFSLEKKIESLMTELKLNFGSLDFILDKNGDFIFLEVNPVGQFGMTSKPNNYGIEYKIAEILEREEKIANPKRSEPTSNFSFL